MYDEFHVYVTQANFRHKIKHVARLSKLDCQKIAMTATLPPQLEGSLIKVIGLAPNTRIIREPCYQPHVKYHLISMAADQKQSQLHEVIRNIMKRANNEIMQEDSRAIIFFTSRKECETFAKANGYGCHISGQDTANDKTIKAWRAGLNKRTMCATPGFCAGIDQKYVDITIYVGYPYTLIDFVQGCGRGGRAGRTSYAILLDIPDAWRENKEEEEEPKVLLTEMKDWCRKDSGNCHRILIHKVMDGKGVRCKDIPGAVLCDRCDPHDSVSAHLCNIEPSDEDEPPLPYAFPSVASSSNPPSSPKKRDRALSNLPSTLTHKRSRSNTTMASTFDGQGYQRPSTPMVLDSETSASSLHHSAGQRNLEDGMKEMVKLLTKALVFFTNKCPLCLLAHKQTATEKNRFCWPCYKKWEALQKQLGFEYLSWKKNKLRYPSNAPFEYCFRCNCPQDPYLPDGHLVLGEWTSMTPHNYQDIISQLVIMIRLSQHVWNEMCDRFLLDPSISHAQYTQWLLEEHEEGFNNMMHVFIWAAGATKCFQ